MSYAIPYSNSSAFTIGGTLKRMKTGGVKKVKETQLKKDEIPKQLP